MFTKPLLPAAALAACLASPLWGATVLVTEGNGQARPTVAGSHDLEDIDSASTGFDLNDVASVPSFDYGHVIGIHGRIVSAEDRFTFSVRDGAVFDVRFDFDGYTLEGGGVVAPGLSGLVTQSASREPDLSLAAKGVRIALLDDTLTELDSITYGSHQTSATTTNASIFSELEAGTYTLVVDGSVGPNTNAAALYDIEVSIVPLPLPLLMLTTGLGGLVLLGRRRPAQGRARSGGPSPA